MHIHVQQENLAKYGGDPINKQQPATVISLGVISLQSHWMHVQ